MKRSVTLTLLALGSLSMMQGAPIVTAPSGQIHSQAKNVRQIVNGQGSSAQVKTRAAGDFDPYYPPANGVLYIGLSPEADTPSVYYALTPGNAELEFVSAFTDGDNIWTYINESGKEVDVEAQSIKVSYAPQANPIDAPYLYCMGYGGRGGYSMAKGGLAVGYGSIPTGSGWDYYGGNINPEEVGALFYDAATLSVNYADANTALAKEYPGVSNLTIKGFGEVFSYCSPYTLDAIRADVVYADAGAPTTADLVAEVYPFDKAKGPEFDKLLATYTASSFKKHDDYFYGFDFVTEKAPLIKSEVIVIIRPAEDCKRIISPSEVVSSENHEGEPGTSYVYASYTAGGKEIENGVLGYFGIDMRSYGRTFYLNHWPVSIKRTYVEDVAEPAIAHAYRMGDTQKQFGFFSFPTNDLTTLTTDKTISAGSPQVGAGEYVDGKIYSYTYDIDLDWGDGLELDQFVVWDPADAYKKLSGTYVSGNRVVDMTFDYTTNTMYAMVELKKSDSGKLGATALHVVDMASGEVTLVGTPGDIKAQNGYGNLVDEHLMSIAASPSGELFAMGEYRQLYKVDKYTGLATAVGSRSKVAFDNDFQTMAFDAEGNLYAAWKHPDYEYFMQIDPETGGLINPVTGEEVAVNADFSNNAARFPTDPQVTALYFDGKEVDGGAPLAPTALTAALRNGTANVVDLTWTLPVKDYAGEAVTVTAVKVYRFGTSDAIATLAGSATGYTDTHAPAGDVTYYVVAEAGENVGFPAWTTTVAGADQLEAVGDLKATLADKEVTLTWTAPTATVNGGYADYDNITYIVSRVSGSVVTELASDVKETEFKTSLDKSGTYAFRVVAVSAGVEGVAATSNEVSLTQVATIPYESGFEDEEDGTLWTIVNVTPGSSYGWSIVKGYAYQQLSGKFAQFKTGGSATFPTNDLLASPYIAFEAGSYDLTYYANGGDFDNHTYAVLFGEDVNAELKTLAKFEDVQVYDKDNTEMNKYQKIDINFNVEKAGNYQLIFQGIGCATYATLKIDNVSIKVSEGSSVAEIEVEDQDAPAYNLMGIPVDDDYKGIVIKNGKKIIRR